MSESFEWNKKDKTINADRFTAWLNHLTKLKSKTGAAGGDFFFGEKVCSSDFMLFNTLLTIAWLFSDAAVNKFISGDLQKWYEEITKLSFFAKYNALSQLQLPAAWKYQEPVAAAEDDASK